jgi:hypothetical protein
VKEYAENKLSAIRSLTDFLTFLLPLELDSQGMAQGRRTKALLYKEHALYEVDAMN